MAKTIHVTVAAIAVKDDRFLLVREQIRGESVVNQPAGHWEPGETLLQAVVRETREETGWEFEPRGLVGIYHWDHPGGRDSFLRFAFHGEAARTVPGAETDAQIEQVVWWSEPQIRSPGTPLRSPMVLRCVEDYRNGARYTLDCLRDIQPSPV